MGEKKAFVKQMRQNIRKIAKGWLSKDMEAKTDLPSLFQIHVVTYEFLVGLL